VLASTLVLTFYSWGPSLDARFGPIDDHLIANFLGPDHAMSLDELPGQVMRAEVGRWGESLRYRPSYWVLESFQCWLFGDSPRAWYGARLAGYALTVAVAWLLLLRAAGPVVGSAFALLVATRPFWAAVWACLGVGESFVAVGMALAAAGALGCGDRRRWVRAAGWLLVLAGVVMAVGSKENVPFLTLLPLWLLWRARRRHLAGCLEYTVTAVCLLFTVWVSAAIVVALARHGRDVYQRPATAGALAPAVAGGLLQKWYAIPPVLASVAFWTFTMGGRRRYLRMLAARWLTLSALLGGCLLVQFIFYRGGWDFHSRYAFPGELIAWLLWLLPWILLWRHRRALGPFPKPLAVAAHVVAVCGIGFVAWHAGLAYNRHAAEANAVRTRNWSEVIGRLAAAARADGSQVISLYGAGISQYESYHSARDFLRFEGVANPIVLRLPPEFGRLTGRDEQGAALANEIRGWAAGQDGFAPPALLEGTRPCLEAAFTVDAVPESRCRFIGRLLK
jgi:hypothetical protein